MASITDAAVEARIGYAFKDRALLHRALTHSSASERRPNNETLEFLGDRVLGLVVAERLFRAFPAEAEGKLNLKLVAAVNYRACAAAARRVGLADAIIRSSSIEADNETMLADCCEAVLGAIYLDGGLEAARAFVERAWAEDLDAGSHPAANAKSLLQEWALARKKPLPRYETLSRSGPDHAPTFVVEVTVEGAEAQRAEGKSKQDAEAAAAYAALREVGALP